MIPLHEVRVGVRPLMRLLEVVPGRRVRRLERVARETARRLSRRVVWNLNSTAVGGGVAEMLQSLLGYTRSVGIDARWIVISGTPEFFRITKRLHHALHGSAGGAAALDDDARAVYEKVSGENAAALAAHLRPGDVVILHDPQTAGLARALDDAGARVIWRCHVGADLRNEHTEAGWRFLRPYVDPVSHCVFSRASYVPDFLGPEQSEVIQPSIDAFSAKNQPLDGDRVRSILVHTGLVEGPPPPRSDCGFEREDGSPGRVERRADVVRSGRAPAWQTPLIVQVSRWDPLKDMQGVMQGFARLCESSCPAAPELVLAGPDVRGVSDDPEGELVFSRVEQAWRALPPAIRGRVHLVSLPTDDIEENAAIVNALQRHATLVVQKSLQEGFGLTVTEAMWKAKPVVASRIGGIRDQIEDGRSGVLLDDPADLDRFARVLVDLLADAPRMHALGDAAHARVRDRFLGVDHLLSYAKLLARIDSEAEA